MNSLRLYSVEIRNRRGRDDDSWILLAFTIQIAQRLFLTLVLNDDLKYICMFFMETIAVSQSQMSKTGQRLRCTIPPFQGQPMILLLLILYAFFLIIVSLRLLKLCYCRQRFMYAS